MTPIDDESVSGPDLLPNPWRASAWLAALFALYLAASAGFVFLLQQFPEALNHAETEEGQLTFVAWLYLVQFLILLPSVLVLSHFSRQPWYVTLAIRPVRAKTLFIWVSVWAVYQALAVALDQIYQPTADDFLAKINGSAHWGLSAVVVLLAPILEEALFRGYLHKAWRGTRLGVTGTVLLTGFLFTALHAGQYHVSVLLQLWLLALILGWSREQSGSIVTPWLLHTLNNLFATIMVTYHGYY